MKHILLIPSVKQDGGLLLATIDPSVVLEEVYMPSRSFLYHYQLLFLLNWKRMENTDKLIPNLKEDDA